MTKRYQTKYIDLSLASFRPERPYEIEDHGLGNPWPSILARYPVKCLEWWSVQGLIKTASITGKLSGHGNNHGTTVPLLSRRSDGMLKRQGRPHLQILCDSDMTRK